MIAGEWVETTEVYVPFSAWEVERERCDLAYLANPAEFWPGPCACGCSYRKWPTAAAVLT